MNRNIQFFHVVFCCLLIVRAAFAQDYDVWIGTEGPNGIYHARFNKESGALSSPAKVADLHGAGFLAADSSGRRMYSAGRIDGKGCVVSFDIRQSDSKSKGLVRSSFQYIPENHHSAHVSLDHQDSFLFAAQYGGSSIAAFQLAEDGKIGPLTASVVHKGGSGVVKNRQDNPHPHWIGVDTTNSIVAVPDLGMDQIVRYRFNGGDGSLTQLQPWAVPPGSGPRHMKFHRNGRFAYVLNEFTMSVSVFVAATDQQNFKLIQEIKSLPDDLRDNRLNTCAEIRIHPNGQFVYTSNRGHDSISVFSVDESTGRLKFVERESVRGSWPRNFNITPCGNWLIAAGKYSNTLSVFEITSEGRLEFTRTVRNVPRPICVVIVPRS